MVIGMIPARRRIVSRSRVTLDAKTCRTGRLRRACGEGWRGSGVACGVSRISPFIIGVVAAVSMMGLASKAGAQAPGQAADLQRFDRTLEQIRRDTILSMNPEMTL